MSSFKTIMANDLEQLIRKGTPINLIDVRETFEYQMGHIPGSVNMPLSQFDLVQLDKEKEYHLICQSGNRSNEASKVLASYGFKIVNVMGGTGGYRGRLE